MARFVLIIFIFMFGANAAAAASDVSQFVFTTEPQTIKPNEISQKITIQAQDASGESSLITQTACLDLKTTSSAGEFSSSDTNWIPVQRLTMSKSSANRNFYYKDSAQGVYELSVNISFRPEGENSSCASWPIENWDIKWNAKQNITVSSSQNNPPPDNNQQQPAAEPAGGLSWPTEEQIFANAGEDKTAVAGADLMFSGKALGIKKEPLENARYSWNFGDGAMAEGQNTRHFYKYPGNYIAVLDVSSGKFSTSDKLNVKVVPNELQITEANKDFIKIKNKSNVLLDISGWFLRKNKETFQFPESSLIAANADLIISSDTSKIKLNLSDAVELLYPNGSVAFTYEYKVNSRQLVAASQTSSPTPSPFKGEGVGEDNSAKRPVFDNNNKTEKENTVVEHFTPPAGSVSNNIVATSSEQEKQLANIVAVVDKKDFWKDKWFFLTISLGIFAAAGLFFIRRYGDTSPKSESDEFDTQS